MAQNRLHTTSTLPGATLGPSSHDLTLLDDGGRKHELHTAGSVLVLDPALALQCEAAGLDYVYVNPAHLVLLSVETRREPPPPPVEDPEPTLEVLATQLNGQELRG